MMAELVHFRKIFSRPNTKAFGASSGNQETQCAFLARHTGPYVLGFPAVFLTSDQPASFCQHLLSLLKRSKGGMLEKLSQGFLPTRRINHWGFIGSPPWVKYWRRDRSWTVCAPEDCAILARRQMLQDHYAPGALGAEVVAPQRRWRCADLVGRIGVCQEGVGAMRGRASTADGGT